MKFKATISFTYEVPDEKIERIYGTTDPSECAKVDERNMNEDPETTIQIIDENVGNNSDISVEPVESKE